MNAAGLIEVLRARVDKAGSQKEVAKSLGISGAYLSDLLAARREPGPTVLAALGFEKSYQRVKKKRVK